MEPAIATRAVAIAPTARLPIVKCGTLFHPVHDTRVPNTDTLNGRMLEVSPNRVNIKRDGYNAEYQRYDHANNGSDFHT